ncbi:MAG TPA: DUF5668 domain-containing protein [Candidatus Limnocylindria bacterium]|nr:DUF5668 domain-containing protein [Candidatus Limnocylindria bacterium]
MITTRRGLFLPLLLITIGIVFLLVNFGYIPGISALSLLSLWPLLLILAGVDIAIGRRWPVAALAIDVGVIALGLALVVTQPAIPGGAFWFASTGTGETDVTVERQSAKTLSLDINGGAGRFHVSGGATALVEAHSDSADLHLRQAKFDRSGEQANVRVDQGLDRGGVRFGGSNPASFTLKIASDVKTALEINAGAGEFDVDLHDVSVTSADLNVGAASLTLILPKPSGNVSVTIDAGASSINIEVPDGVEARITTSGALLTMRSTNARLAVSGSTAETSGYAASRDHVTVRVTAGVSSISIR